jgi:penicillin-binding protein 2
LKFGLGNKVLNDSYLNEKKGLVPSTEWKKNTLGKGWVLGESLITGIGQGYIQTTPLQLCLMTAQLANGGHKIYPRIVVDKNQISAEDIKNQMKIDDDESKAQGLLRVGADFFNLGNKKYSSLYENQKNVRYVLESMFSSTNEVSGTSYRSRIDNPKYQFAGKTGTSQVKRITERDRELELKTSQIPYEERDHALYIAFGPYKNPKYAVSIIVEHGGSGSSTAAPIAKKLFKLIIDRHELREAARKKNTILT